MRTARFQTQTQTRMDAEMLHDAVVRDGRFTHRVNGHMGTLGRMATDRLLYRTA